MTLRRTIAVYRKKMKLYKKFLLQRDLFTLHFWERNLDFYVLCHVCVVIVM